MRYYSHIATSVAGTMALTQYTNVNIDLSIGLLAGVIFGSLLPDIDEPQSKIGRKVPGVSHVIKMVFGHRGFTHTLLAAALFAYVLLKFSNISIVQGIAIGYLLHIVGDCFSKYGMSFIYAVNQ